MTDDPTPGEILIGGLTKRARAESSYYKTLIVVCAKCGCDRFRADLLTSDDEQNAMRCVNCGTETMTTKEADNEPTQGR